MTLPGRAYLDQVPVAGISSLVFAEYDYTHPDVASEFYTQLSVLNEIVNRTITPPARTTPNFTSTDVDNVNAALAALQDLAINGISANSTANLIPPVVTMKQYFLTVAMATNLDLLFRSFLAVGATGTPPVIDLQQLGAWKDLSIVSPVIQDILRSSTIAVASNRSLQSLIELEYVKTGSDLIGEKLSSLNDALTITQQVLNSLANLQDLRNRLVIQDRTGYTLPTSAMINPLSDGVAGIHAADIMSAYRGAASLYFNAPLVPQLAPTLLTGGLLNAAGQTVYSNLLMIQKSLLNFLPRLSATLSPEARADSNSIYGRIKKITEDFSTMFQVGGVAAADLTSAADKTKALNTYLLDNNVSAFKVAGHNAGDGQADLNFGITAGQALNDTQKEDVRRFLNIFEEYYKSASSILQRISQIIEKMAQNISR